MQPPIRTHDTRPLSVEDIRIGDSTPQQNIVSASRASAQRVFFFLEFTWECSECHSYYSLPGGPMMVNVNPCRSLSLPSIAQGRQE